MTTPRPSWPAVIGLATLLAATTAFPAAAEESEEGSLGSSVIPLLTARPSDSPGAHGADAVGSFLAPDRGPRSGHG